MDQGWFADSAFSRLPPRRRIRHASAARRAIPFTNAVAPGFQGSRAMYDHARLFARLSAALTDDPGASLERLARGLRIHPHTAAQVVREHTGTTFSRWRAGRRLARSCVLLRTRPDLSIKEVAAAAGFNSTSVFDRFLRRSCGRSPSECRLATPIGGVDRQPGVAASPGSIVNALDPPSTPPGAQPFPCSATLKSFTASS
jgi:AraC-like DNA-binding protein